MFGNYLIRTFTYQIEFKLDLMENSEMNFFSINLFGEELFIGLELRFDEKVIYSCIGEREICKSFKVPASMIIDENWHLLNLKFNGINAAVHIDGKLLETHGNYTIPLLRGEENFRYLITLNGENFNMKFKTIKFYSGFDTPANERVHAKGERLRRTWDIL